MSVTFVSPVYREGGQSESGLSKPIGRVFTFKKFLLIIVVSSIIAGGAMWLTQASYLRTVVMHGKVVSATTHQPVSEVFVAVESVLPYAWEGTGLGRYVQTDMEGRFSAEVKGDISIRAWREGYALADEAIGSSRDLPATPVNIEIRELESSDLVPEYILREGFTVGDGFSLRLGKIVSGDSQEADFRLISESNGERIVQALGKGGVLYQTYSRGVDFYNTPEAPSSGYLKQVQLEPDSMGLFYVITRDGEHYGKIRLIAGGLKQTSQGSDSRAYWPQFAYQPNGTRNLEIAVCKDYIFPFEKFGLKREPTK
jgi:hypothetical protein